MKDEWDKNTLNMYPVLTQSLAKRWEAYSISYTRRHTHNGKQQ